MMNKGSYIQFLLISCYKIVSDEFLWAYLVGFSVIYYMNEL